MHRLYHASRTAADAYPALPERIVINGVHAVCDPLGGLHLPDHDVLVVSDVDEILRPSTLRTLRACAFPRRLTLASRFYYYSFQWLHRGPEWPHPQATYYQGLKNTLLPNDLRIADGGMWPFREWEKGTMANASWHCSSCFATVGELLGKMASGVCGSGVSSNTSTVRPRARRVPTIVSNSTKAWV